MHYNTIHDGNMLTSGTFICDIHCFSCHYPGTVSDAASVKTNKPLWASEDYSTFNDNVGAGCWARVRSC